MFNYCFDIGGTSTKCIIFKNNILFKNFSFVYKKSEINSLEDFQTPFINILDQISDVLNKETKEFNLSIVLPGIIDSKNKKVLTQSAIKDIDIDLIKYFKKYSNLKKFVLLNDAKAAALGEYNERIKSNFKIANMVHLTIGTAIGCGIIINKKLFTGNTFQAGEIGKMYSSLKKEDTSTVALDTGLGTVLIKYFIKTGKKITGENFFELYNQKDETVVEMMEDFTSHLAKLIINLNFLLDFDLITLGGGVSSNKQFVSLIKEKIIKHKDFYWQEKLFYSCENLENKFDVSILKNQAACYGGLYLLNKEEK